MELELTVVDPDHPGSPFEVVVSAPAGTAAAELTGPLLAAAHLPAQRRLVLGSGEPLGPRVVLGVPPLVRGAVLALVPEGAPDRPPGAAGPWTPSRALLALHVVSGPDAGHVLPLPPGRHVVGRASGASLRLEDPGVSREHVEVDVGGDGVRARDRSSANGTRLDGELLGAGWQQVPTGGRLALGSTVLVLRGPGTPPASTRAAGDGHVDVNRGPRLVPGATPVQVRLPDAPEPPIRPRLPVLGVVLPVLVAVPMALLWSPLALLLALTGPLVALGTSAGERRAGRRTHADQVAEHGLRTAQARARVGAALRAELDVLEVSHPDPATVLLVAEHPGARLWERRAHDPDALGLRLGTGPVPSGVVVDADFHAGAPGGGHGTSTGRQLHRTAPVVVPLAEVGVVGLCGPPGARNGLARSLLAQAAVLHPPQDLQVTVLGAEPSGAWEWVRWLPHAKASGTGAGVATDPVGVAGHVRELLAVLDERSSPAAGTAGSGGRARPWHLLVLDGAQRLRAVQGVVRLLTDGPGVGILALCLEDAPARLPHECAATGELTGDPVRLEWRPAGKDLTRVRPDLVGLRWTDRVARALAPLREAAPVPVAEDLPGGVRLLDLLAAEGVDATDAVSLRAGWGRRPRSTRAVVGVTATGPWTVDLRQDGPHVLVAGTTGSGKSELLTALVVALAVANRPDELALVLVDYKGGAAFAAVAGLPHTVGLVTDLDAHLTRRALASLDAEVRRRERVLLEHGCRDADELAAQRDAGRTDASLPRLVIVVDEFRVLAEELPEFVSGLVRLAAVGRSLGIHLVLATQRPAGVVSADIRANTNLRIALRVRDEVDSVDVVDGPDAARISALEPGRACARTGGGALVAVRTAQVSGAAAGAGPAGVRVRVRTTGGVGVRVDDDVDDQADEADEPPAAVGHGPDDLVRVVAAVRAAADGVPRVPSPWLPPLPEVVVLDRAMTPDPLPDPAPEREPPVLEAVFGWLDDPVHQLRALATWSVRTPVLVAGGPRSGRTAALRALAAGLATCSPAQVHLHVICSAGGGLEGLVALPHTAAVVPRRDDELVLRLLRGLAREVEQRQAGGGGPRTVLLVDGADRLAADAVASSSGPGEDVSDLLQRLVTDGPSVGVVPVLAGDRTLLTGRVGAAVADRLVLSMPDPTDYLLAGVPGRDVPARMPPGRALRLGPDGVHEVQVALLDADRNPSAQHAATTALATAATRRWQHVPAGARPAVLVALPARLEATDLDRRTTPARHGTPGAASGRRAVPLGVGGQDADVQRLDLVEDPVALVAGPPGSGRSSVLLAVAQRLHTGGSALLVVAPRRSVLTAWAAGRGIGELDASDTSSVRAALAAAAPSAPVVLVDDVELLDAQVEDLLLAQLARATGHHRIGEGAGDGAGALVVAGAAADLLARFRGLVPALRRTRTGLLLHPVGPADGDLLGTRVPRAGSGPPGRATLVRRGVACTVQLALPAPGPALGPESNG